MKFDTHNMKLDPNNTEMENLAKGLCVLRGKSFRVRVTSNKRPNLARLKGMKDYLEHHTFLIGDELLVQGEFDGWSQWYGVDNRLADFPKWVSEGRIAVNFYQTKNTSIRPLCMKYFEGK